VKEDETVESQKSKVAGKTSSGLSAFWAELKRRKVMRVAITYAVVAWLIIQIAVSTFEGFGIPVWAFRFVVIMLLCFFPVAIILAWAFELTPDGIKTTKVARSESADTKDSTSHSKKRNWMAYAIGAAVPTLIFSVLAIFFYVRSDPSDPSDSSLSALSSLPTASDKSIAVLPLENMSPDSENAFFAGGVQEDILNNLSKIKELFVIGRASTLGYKDTAKKPSLIGEESGVRYLVTGSVRRAANQVLVTVQLIDAQSEGQLWSDKYSRALDDIFAIQAEVAQEIARQLKAVLTPEEIEQIERRPTENQEAYDFFVKARDTGNVDDVARRLCEQAVALDPEFAEAWAIIARTLIFEWRWQRHRNDPELLARAHHAFDEAKRLGPGLAGIFRMQNMLPITSKTTSRHRLSIC